MGRFRIIFMGTPEFAVPSLQALIAGPDDVIAVVTQPDRPRGRGRKLSPSPVKVVALEEGVHVLQPEKARSEEFIERVRGLEPDLLVVAAYGQILPQALLDIPKIMPINVHGSLLPKYRGAAPIQWAIINGDAITGITIMKMDAGMDTGPMLLKGELEIGPEETYGELYPRMARLGADLLMKALDLLDKGELQETPQPDNGATYAPLIRPHMAQMDWTRPARELACLIRALDPRPGAYTLWDGQRLRLYRPAVVEKDDFDAAPGTVLEASENGVLVATGHGVLAIRELQMPGKKRIAVGDFLRGRKIPAGTRFESSGQEAS